jgi:hypothetical protein
VEVRPNQVLNNPPAIPGIDPLPEPFEVVCIGLVATPADPATTIRRMARWSGFLTGGCIAGIQERRPLAAAVPWG